MTDTTYTDGQQPAIGAGWLNDLNRLHYTLLGNPSSIADIVSTLGVPYSANTLNPALNLSDLKSASSARSNLGLGTAATKSSSAFVGSTPTTSAGTAAAYTVADSVSAYISGQLYQFVPHADNNGACTVDFGAGAQSIKLLDGNDPAAGDLAQNRPAELLWNGTDFVLLNPYSTHLTEQLVPAATQTGAAVNLGQFSSSLGGSGWKKIPDSGSPSGYIIMQWAQGFTATVAAGSKVSQTVSFPISFPNSMFSVIPAHRDANTGTSVSATGPGLSQFTMNFLNNGAASASMTGAYVAFGY